MNIFENSNKQVVDKMVQLGMNISNKGFQYLVDAVDIILNDGDVKQMYLYSIIADKYKTTATGVERCMRHEIQLYYDTHIFSNEVPDELICNINRNGRLTCREFVYRLAYMCSKDKIPC